MIAIDLVSVRHDPRLLGMPYVVSMSGPEGEQDVATFRGQGDAYLFAKAKAVELGAGLAFTPGGVA